MRTPVCGVGGDHEGVARAKRRAASARPIESEAPRASGPEGGTTGGPGHGRVAGRQRGPKPESRPHRATGCSQQREKPLTSVSNHRASGARRRKGWMPDGRNRMRPKRRPGSVHDSPVRRQADAPRLSMSFWASQCSINSFWVTASLELAAHSYNNARREIGGTPY